MIRAPSAPSRPATISGGAPAPTGSPGLVARKIIDLDDAGEMIRDLAYNLAKKAYHLDAQ